MIEMTGGEAVVKSLLAHGVDTIFGLPGVQNDYLYNALYDARDRMRVIHTRHEQGAAYMALGYAQASGRVGVYSVVPGPGFLNTTAALATAYGLNAQVLCLAGQIPTRDIGRGLGLLHEIPDQLGIMLSLTKWAERIPTPGEAPRLVAEAFRQMGSGRPRPVGLEVPMDVLSARAQVDLSPIDAEETVPEADPEAIEAAARLLGQAKNPLIWVGGGAMEAAEEVQQLAEALQAPVVTYRNGRGILSSHHYLSHTTPAGHGFWAEADVVIGIGSRMQIPLTSWGVDDDLKLIRIDIDPEEMSRIVPPSVGIESDSRIGLRALLSALEKYNPARPSRRAEMEAIKAELDSRMAYLEPQMAYMKAIRQALPEDGIFVNEFTQVGYVSRFAMPVYAPRTYISPGYQGTLGWGFATALGVKVAQPDKPVLAIAGDGGFMFTVQELATAVQHGINTVTVIFNDGAYGNVRRMQQELYDDRIIASELQNPDFVRLAESFGARGLRVEQPEALPVAIRQGFEASVPTVIDVPVGVMPNPWALYRLPKVRGK